MWLKNNLSFQLTWATGFKIMRFLRNFKVEMFHIILNFAIQTLLTFNVVLFQIKNLAFFIKFNHTLFSDFQPFSSNVT